MTSALTRRLVFASTLANSFLYGMNINRAIVDMHAWQQTGPLAWAAFSRHADLAPRAALLYPGSAFAGVILSAAAALSLRHDRGAPRSAWMPIIAAPVLAASGLLMTTKAAPNMLRVPRLGNDAAGLQQALDGFQFWGNIRGLLQVLAYVASLWSLVAIADANRLPAGSIQGGLRA